MGGGLLERSLPRIGGGIRKGEKGPEAGQSAGCSSPSSRKNSLKAMMPWLAEVGEELRRRGLLRKSVERLPEHVLDGETIRNDAR